MCGQWLRLVISLLAPSSSNLPAYSDLVLVIVYLAGQTKRADRNWVSHLLPDMIDKSLPSVISAKLLFRRAAATRVRRLPSPSPISRSFHFSLLLLVVLLTTGLQPATCLSTFHSSWYTTCRSRIHRNQFSPRKFFKINLLWSLGFSRDNDSWGKFNYENGYLS